MECVPNVYNEMSGGKKVCISFLFVDACVNFTLFAQFNDPGNVYIFASFKNLAEPHVYPLLIDVLLIFNNIFPS